MRGILPPIKMEPFDVRGMGPGFSFSRGRTPNVRFHVIGGRVRSGPPFYPVLWEGSTSTIDYRKRGTLIQTSLLEDLENGWQSPMKRNPLRVDVARQSPMRWSRCGRSCRSGTQEERLEDLNPNPCGFLVLKGYPQDGYPVYWCLSFSEPCRTATRKIKRDQIESEPQPLEGCGQWPKMVYTPTPVCPPQDRLPPTKSPIFWWVPC